MSIADRIAGALGARKAGGWWRTSTAHCHGGDTADGLTFRSPSDDPEKLIVHCHTHECHKTTEARNRARDNLRAAAGLDPWQPSRAHTGTGAAQDDQKQRKGSGDSLQAPKRCHRRPQAACDDARCPAGTLPGAGRRQQKH